jgi:H+/gluconate symporter and related permeases
MTFTIIIAAIALQIFLTWKKLSPFLSLLIVAILAGFALGMTPVEVLASVNKGVGNTLSGLVLIICLGAGLGKILEAGGANGKIATTLINGLDNSMCNGLSWSQVFSSVYRCITMPGL